ncbi:SUMO ligase siz1 [Mortierella polycephala]|uniref:SUMO ligase siz1 n=1 Tax=Mortierella polycephala TaxID=41804 RepID=A0A9P6U8P0_9FUNG|nr:SUMO ligase siz1 [Mortierella polycephala]
MEDLSTITGRIIPSLLVTQLKALIKSLNENIRPAPQLKLGGNKSELIHRLVNFITQYHQIGDQTVIRQIRHCVAQFNQGEVTTIATPVVSLQRPHTSSSSNSSNSNSIYNRMPILTSKPGQGQGQQPAQPRHTIMAMASHSRSSHPAQHMQQQQQHHSPRPGMHPQGSMNQTFKPSPFYKDIQVLLPPRSCYEAKDRTSSVVLSFHVPPMLPMQLKKDPDYQLMVFCGAADGLVGSKVPMEFPHVCEIKVNGRVLEANLRGMKNKPGTVSPANITKLCQLEASSYNKIEFIYANSTKRYNVSLHLVKKISVESIVSEIERGKFVSKETLLRMIEDRNKDDDIMATSSTLSLKCPLGFQRITVPCRSSYCQHLQCFDGYTFFNLNEQTPTWTCPVCSRTMLSWEEIVVDGYFKDILNSTPSSLESITVQADGSWVLPSSSSSSPSEKSITPAPKKKAAISAADSSVFVIDEDEDDDEEDEAATEAGTPTTSAKPTKPAMEVINLISDSEDEEDERNHDGDGDTIMQEAANSLQDMSNAVPRASSHSVKTEAVDGPTPKENEAPPPVLTKSQSAVGLGNGSQSGNSSESPIISTRMVQIEPIQTSTPASVSEGMPPVPWNNGEESFMNALLNNPKRKRQFDGTLLFSAHIIWNCHPEEVALDVPRPRQLQSPPIMETIEEALVSHPTYLTMRMDSQ